MVANSIDFKLEEERSSRQEEQASTSSAYIQKHAHYLSRGGKLSLSAFENALSYQPSKEELKSAETQFACGKVSSPMGFKGPSDDYQHKTLAGLIHALERENTFWCSSYNSTWSLPKVARELELLRDYSLPERKAPRALEIVSEYTSGGHWM
ncbi:MAG: hypothetical protein AABY26_04640 [Nanoarchaeota archaeon]